MKIDFEKEEESSRLRGSLLEFTQFFLKYITGREYILSNPPGRESHQKIICRELTKIQRLEVPSQRLIINVPPGHGKTLHLCMWLAWCYTHNPDCNFLYISYSHDLAAKQTAFVKQIMSSPMYQFLFDVKISAETRAKDNFMTTAGGQVSAFGSGGAITGRDAGLPGLERFSGGVIIDDPIKPDEANTDSIRERVIKNYEETIRQRVRGINVPIIFIGQRLHEDDLSAFLLNNKDVRTWDSVILKAIDDAGNPIYPEVNPLEDLHALQEKSPYVFASQFQQDPLPAGGGIYKPEWFVLLDEEPEIVKTFITVDTAETSKTYNDATAMSFWGIYELELGGEKTGDLALHWLDCLEIRVEPKDLQEVFTDFWQQCMTHPVKPRVAAIEKKSTGVTLLSMLQEMRGITIRDIKRNKTSGSKTDRFLEIQPLIASRLLSLPKHGTHTDLCLTHMKKITANQTHRHDDVCFIAGTKIATKYGYKNIEDIKIGDSIITPFGYGKVSCAKSTGKKPIVTNKRLTGTTNHPIFIKDKFISLDTVCDGDRVSSFSFKELLEWKYKKLLSSMELSIGSWDRDAIILVSQTTIKKEKALRDCMLRFGNFIADKKYLKAMLFIIKTIIILITVMKTLSVFHAANILKRMQKIGKNGLEAMRIKNILKKLGNWLRFGIKAKMVKNGIEKMQQPVLTKSDLLNVEFAGINLMREVPTPPIVQKNVLISNMQGRQEKSVLEKEVFNLTVERYGVYYANGILVSNCDTLYDACKIALIDKTLYSSENASGRNHANILHGLNESFHRRRRAGDARNAT